jgi:hypothetical protein
MTSPFDIIKSFNEKTEMLVTDEHSEKEYTPFVVNRGLSFMRDTILYAAEINKYSCLDKKLQHDFYYYAIPKGKRFGKWEKRIKNEDIVLIQTIYSCSEKVAIQYLDILNEEAINTLKLRMEQGGKYGRKSGGGDSRNA